MVRFAVQFVVALLIILALVVGGFVYFFQRGTAGIDDWVVRQVVAITETYIVPKIEFESFDYQAPGTVELRGVRFVAPDSTEVIRAETVRLTLASIPRRNRPITIRDVRIENGALRLIRPAPGEAPAGTLFKGLAPFVRTENVLEQDKLAPEVRLSEALEIRELSLVNAAVEYVEPGREPMALSDLTVTLNLEPPREGAEAGWYTVNTAISRAPIFDLDIAGRVNLDTMIAEVEPLRLRMNLSEETYGSLPPQLQEILRRHEAIGRMEAQVNGALLLRDTWLSRMEAGLWVDELTVSAGDYRVPIQEARFEARLANRRLSLERATIETLEGVITLPSAEMNFDTETRQAYVTWDISGVKIQNFLRTRATDGSPRFAGAISTTGEATLQGTRPLETLDGRGELFITEGRLVYLPVIHELVSVMNLATRLGGAAAMEDTAAVNFRVRSQQVVVEMLDMRSQVVAARGQGTIGFDQQLDLELNAGPLEKVQSLLGPIGAALGRITDHLVKYHVGGQIGDVKISVRPLGI